MGFLKIKCHNCGGSWEVYKSGLTAEASRNCPHCFREVDRQTWNNDIVPAFHSMDDANRELLKEHSGYKTTLFEVAYQPNTVFKNGGIFN